MMLCDALAVLALPPHIVTRGRPPGGRSVRFCTIPECGRRFLARGWCRVHYDAWEKWGNPLFVKSPKQRRLRTLRPCPVHGQCRGCRAAIANPFDRVSPEPNSGCWIWIGAVNFTTGYGVLGDRGRTVYAHRIFYERHVGPIPAGLTIDHLCRNRQCVNPKHLEAVTLGDNIRRSPIAPAAINARKTRCPYGHSLDNAYRTKRGRACRTCWNARARRRYHAKKARGLS